MRFNISTDFFKLEPSLWINSEEFKKVVGVVKNLSVVNAATEKAVKFIEEYNKVLTRKENEKQYLLQLVKHYHKKYPSHTKTSLKN